MSTETDKWIYDKKAEINNYENMLYGLLAFHKYIRDDLNGYYYFGGKLTKTGNTPVTPDIIINLHESYVVGEAKKSMKSPPSTAIEKLSYIETYLKREILEQIKSYDKIFDNLPVQSQDLFLFAPEINYEALGILKYDFLDNNTKYFNNNFSIITYVISSGANIQNVLVKYDYGLISDQILFDKLKRGIKYNVEELSKQFARYKIYEENSGATPIEYVMYILWSSVFQEITKASEKSMIIERYKKQENTFEVKLSKLMEYLREMYILPTYAPNGTGGNINRRQQFKSEMVKKAMDLFCKIGLAKEIDENPGAQDTSYEITLKQLPEKSELDYFLRKIAKIEETPKRDVEGLLPIDKWEKN